jgi:ABC-2 type transport system permease protein
LGIIDFLIPGIIAMSIMQLGIFSVAFGFVSFKTTGALRRLQATPTRPLLFIIAQSTARVLIGVIQVLILISLGTIFFHIHMVGNLAEFLVASTLGVIVFLAFGFCVAGWAKDENQAAPIANLITFPMLFLSGIFFPRDGFPAWLKTVTDFFPLTYLSDGLRRIANEGASLGAIRGDLLGMTIWGVIVFFVAVLVFRWE